ncbi:MAG: YheT family hydrolase, partial [Rhodothermales bacterium]
MIIESAYRAEGVWRNPHLNTIWASKVRSVDTPARERRRLDTPDGDFLDVDCLMQGSRKAAILLHGLEGSADRTYMRGMTHALAADGWDVLAMNLRGCSGEPNLLPRSYHSGATEDLRAVLDAFGNGYDTMAAVGFSLGGNLLLNIAPHPLGRLRFDDCRIPA